MLFESMIDWEKIEENLPSYKDGESPYELMKSQSDYLKDTVPALQKIAQSAKEQADASNSIADSAKRQSDSAEKKSKKADIKGWIAIFISAVALLLEFFINRAEILDFFQSFFNK